jgi:hypothetical protein
MHFNQQLSPTQRRWAQITFKSALITQLLKEGGRLLKLWYD